MGGLGSSCTHLTKEVTVEGTLMQSLLVRVDARLADRLTLTHGSATLKQKECHRDVFAKEVSAERMPVRSLARGVSAEARPAKRLWPTNGSATSKRR